MKYSVIFPYFNRYEQLKCTLSSFFLFYSTRDDFEVIIIEDQKQTDDMHYRLLLLIEMFKDYINITLIRTQAEISFSPSTAYNEGVSIANGTFLIISNPECQHDSDILSELDKEFEHNENTYVVCACKALRRDFTAYRWHHHSVSRNTMYHFCCGISKKNYLKANGFDERYTKGIGYDDNSFRDRVKSLGIPFSLRDDLVVSHLWHEKVRPPKYKELVNRNKLIYEDSINQMETGAVI